MSGIKKISFYTRVLIFPMGWLHVITGIRCQWSRVSDYDGKYPHAIVP